MLTLPEKVLVTEVAPRDGLQSLGHWVPTDDKVRLIDRLSEVGFPVIEVTAFAHPRVIPSLRDAEEVCERIARRKGTVYRGLVPNARGAERAVAAKVDEILGLITVSATYLAKNQNMTMNEAVDQGVMAFRIADKHGIAFVMALGMAMWCPYEGLISQARVCELVRQFRNAGIRRFYLAGSVGMEDPRHVSELFGRLYDKFPDIELGYHVHNLAGRGTANVLAALDAGARWIEGSICGLGGGIAMPTTLGSVGNLATEDIVLMLSEMGIETGLQPSVVVAAARDVASQLGIQARSYALNTGTRNDVQEQARLNPRYHPS